MTRRLTGEEHALWEQLGQTVKPLRKRRAARAEPSATAAPRATEDTKDAKPPKTERASRAPSPPKRETAAPPLAPFEERTLRRLGRGLLDVDARIDLHGMRQERAFAALATFLRREQAHGARIVLVVTGKGKAGEDGRGVLRQSVPAWLARDDLRQLVVGVEEAHRRHGGAGALYVRIRRRREVARSQA